MLKGLYRRFKRSIAASFIVVVLVILVIGQGSLWVWFLFTQKTHAKEVLMGKVSMAASFVAVQAEHAFTDHDLESLTQQLERVAEDDDIISLKVFDKDNNIVTQVVSTNVRREQTVNPFYINWQGRYVADVGPEGNEYGSVLVVYSGEGVNSYMTSLLITAPIVQLLVFVLIIYAIYFFFQRRVGGPVTMLQDAITKVTGGDFGAEIPELRDNELGDIAQGLRFLVERLSGSISKLNSTAVTVSETILQLRNLFQKPVLLIKRQADALDEIVFSLRRATDSQRDIAGRSDKVSAFSQENVSSLLEVRATADEIVASMNILLDAAEGSYSIVEELSQTSKVMSGNAREVLESVENTSASVEEVMASVREVERNAKDSSSLAENVRVLAAQRGVNVVADAVGGMERISGKVRFAVDIVKKLESRSSDIQKILSVIRDVTERTNLLSLNASILAEQAGEYGKGFAVIADEMRDLSERTASYTKDITGIVKTIRAEISDAMDTIEESMQMVRQGGDTVYQVGETMSDILESAHKSAIMTKMIEGATEDQARALRHIETSVIEINKMTLDMSRAMDEQSKASSFMLDRVGEVREIAETTQKSTKDQAQGTRAIAANLDEANEQIAGIQEAAFAQQKVNDQILSSVEGIRKEGEHTVQNIEGVAELLNKLRKEMDLLKKEMGTLGAE